MGTISIIIQTDNDAFVEDPHGELNRVLKEIGERAMSEEELFTVRDINGNTVASVIYKED